MERAWRSCPASPARSEQHRSRMSAPTGRRSLVDLLGPHPGPAARIAEPPSPRPTVVSAIAARGSSARRPRTAGRYLILSVTFQLRLGSLSAPVRYAELARTLGVAVGERVPAPAARQRGARACDRQGHGAGRRRPRHLERRILLHQPDPGPGARGRAAGGAPRFARDGRVIKTSAAWLIEAAGFGKGYGRRAGPALDKHVLALTNRGGARPRTCWPWPARSAPASRTGSASIWCPSRSCGDASCEVLEPFIVWGADPGSGPPGTGGTGRSGARRGPGAPADEPGRGGWWHPDGAVARTHRTPEFDYGYRLDGSRAGAARIPGRGWQPHGVHGLVPHLRPESFAWNDHALDRTAAGRRGDLRAARRDLHRRRDPGRPPSAGWTTSPSWASTSSSSCRSTPSTARTTGATTGCSGSRCTRSTADRSATSSSSTPATGSGWA